MPEDMVKTQVQVTPQKAAEMKVEQIKDPDLVKTVVLVSPKGHIGEKDWKRLFHNLMWLAVPIYGGSFFAGMIAGLEPKAAAMTALVALYLPLRDFFVKLQDGPTK